MSSVWRPSARAAAATAVAGASSATEVGPAAVAGATALPTLTSFLTSQSLATAGVDADLALLLLQVAAATKQIACAVARMGIENLQGVADSGSRNVSGDEQKKLDVVANDIMVAALRDSGRVAVAASEEDSHPILLVGPSSSSSSPLPSASCPPFCVVFDPLDGSRNIDAGIPTGTIFGIYRVPAAAQQQLLAGGPAAAAAAEAVALQAGTELVCAGYSLYSSATVLALAMAEGDGGVHGFTLDHAIGEFVLTNPSMRAPERGQIYSVNDARYFDWPAGLQRYIDDIRQGKGQSKKKYSARYICSLVADFHRTLLYGGVAMNPRSHLRLVYEANPLSFLAERAGGKGSDGKQRILSIVPQQLHQRLPLFLGSSKDIDELESYGDVQQLVNPGYNV